MRNRSEWPRGLRHELSSHARKLGSWVCIQLGALMSVRVYCVLVLSCVHVEALQQAESTSKELCRSYTGLGNWGGGGERGCQDQTKGCRAIPIFITGRGRLQDCEMSRIPHISFTKRRLEIVDTKATGYRLLDRHCKRPFSSASASNRNEYQKQKNNVSGRRGRPVPHLATICEPIV
jgi:hypothetical protein